MSLVKILTPDEWYKMVEGLKLTEVADDSKAAPGIKIFNSKNGIRVNCTRSDKTVRESEIESLAIEYSLDKLDLKNLLDARKFKITNEAGEAINGKPKRTRVPKAKTHDDNGEGERALPCPDKLL